MKIDDSIVRRSFNRRYPLTNYRSLHTFKHDDEGFKALANMASVNYVDKIPNAPVATYNNTLHGALYCECEAVHAGLWRSVRRDYPQGLDISGVSCMNIGANCLRFAPGDEYYIRLRLVRNGYKGDSDVAKSEQDVYEGVSRILPEFWNSLIYDISECKFLADVGAIEIAYANSGDELYTGAFAVGDVSVGDIVDLSFDVDGSEKHFTCENGALTKQGRSVAFEFGAGAALTSPHMPETHNTIYNMLMEIRNTMFFVMRNDSDADKLRISFITQDDAKYDKRKSKVFKIEPRSDKQAYFFNFSDVKEAHGRLAGFKIEPLGGTGVIYIHRITFEEEERIVKYAGKVESCTVELQGHEPSVVVSAKIKKAIATGGKFDSLRLYETSMRRVEDTIDGCKLLFEMPLQEQRALFAFPYYIEADKDGKGRKTHLASQFILAVCNSKTNEYQLVNPRFYIENWEDVTSDIMPPFDLPNLEVAVTDFGARADSYTDDTDAIQAAIDYASSKGGGRVTLPYVNTGRYIITNILMKSNIELHFDDGVTLWQSQEVSDYKYDVFIGHDVPMHEINWTHALHVANLPLIQAKYVNNIKITGHGFIRSADNGSEQRRIGGFPAWPSNCRDRIHCITLGFFGVQNVELKDFDIIRANNYHMSIYASTNIFIGNVKMYDVKCLSGDGIGFNCGTNNVHVTRCFFESNDDGVVITASYNDPRGKKWWWPCPGTHNGLHDIVVESSYFNSGGGKAIAFITWGSDDPNPENEEIYNIVVSDCILQGGYAVGTWPDNPYHGKVPFDNSETDDYSAVKQVYIYNNEYRSKSSMLCIKPTTFIFDGEGIHSASEIQNHDFRDGKCYWSWDETGEVVIDRTEQRAVVSACSLYQGLYLTEGEYEMTAEVAHHGCLFVADMERVRIAEHPYWRDFDDCGVEKLHFTIEEEGDYLVGSFAGVISSLQIAKKDV